LGRVPGQIYTAIASASAAVIFSATMILIWLIGPEVETRLFPVVGKLNIERMEVAPNGQTKVYASFRKLRACEYIGIAWFRGDRASDFTRVSLVLDRAPGDDSNPNRPVGFQRSGPWTVDIPMDEIPSNSFVQLFHKCHFAWTTTTEFYP